MNILVSGGSGFIGTWLVRDLLAKGHHVTIFDKRESQAYPKLVIIGDVRNLQQLQNALSGIDVIYHLAAEHRDDVMPKSLYHDVNVGGAKNVIQAAEQHGISKIIFTSSVALYGLNAGSPSEESTINPFNEYGQSKYEAEVVFQNWVDKQPNRSLVIVRPVVIFGEKNRGNVYNLLVQIAAKHFVMVGKGNNKKSMGYVRNISCFLVKCLDFGNGLHIYNYADKPDLTTTELIKIVQTSFNRGDGKREVRLPYSLALMGGYLLDVVAFLTRQPFAISSIRIKKFCAETTVDTRRLQEMGFAAPYSLEEGLKRMIQVEFPSVVNK